MYCQNKPYLHNQYKLAEKKLTESMTGRYVQLTIVMQLQFKFELILTCSKAVMVNYRNFYF
jgi:hypothetical protein